MRTVYYSRPHDYDQKQACPGHPPENSQCGDLPLLNSSLELTEQLGQGDSATTWAVEDTITGLKYVIPFSTNKDYTFKNIEGGSRACQINGQHLMKLVDVVCHGNVVAPLMTRCRGANAVWWFFQENARYSKKSNLYTCVNLDSQETVAIIRGLFAAVAELHSARLQHRDLDFSNVMYYRQNTEICIIDYNAGVVYPDEWLIAPSKQSSSLLETQVDVDKMDIDIARAMLYPKDETVGGVDDEKDNKGVVHFRWVDDTLSLGAMMLNLLGIHPPKLYPDAKWIEMDVSFVELVELLGTNEITQYLKQLGDWPIPGGLKDSINGNSKEFPKKRVDWKQFSQKGCNDKMLTKETIRLLDGVLQYSFKERLKFILNEVGKTQN